ncbi:Tll0287-like domain-containing protein [Virgifigura deserti]|uniref:Tll0287-like domain-containing protein n=1 Tax=Virgifigura deserti TaxID=2268457 RepID=UPI003CCC31B5
MSFPGIRSTWLACGFALCCSIFGGAWSFTGSLSAAQNDDTEIALTLATMLSAARTVISSNQDLINDPDIADKGLTGDVVVARAMAIFRKQTGTDPAALDANTRRGRLLNAQMEAIAEVVDAHQDVINAPGVGFKGFVPAVFGRLVNEAFEKKMGHEVHVKVTAPPELIRNRKARPDRWETEIIKTKLLSEDWPRKQPFSTMVEKNGRDAFRIMVPEYYTAGCLTCHGEPRGEIDITGYPKEGGSLGDLGGAISITLFH